MKYRITPIDYIKGKPWLNMNEARQKSNAPKYRVLFIYSQKELLTLAATMAYVQGRTVINADPTARVAISQWFDVHNEENAPIIQSALDTALTELEAKLSALSPGRLERDRSYDVHTSLQKELVTEFIVGAGTKDSVLLNMQLAIKNYLIDSVLTEWAGLTRPDNLEYWKTRADIHLESALSSGRQCLPVVAVRKFPAW